MNTKILSKHTLLYGLFFFSPAVIQAAGQAELDCMVKPEMYVELSTAETGIIENLLVKRGDIIQKGQPLAQLEDSVQQAKVKLAEQQANSYSDIKNRETQLQFAKRNQKRMRGLSSKNSVSLIEKDKAETEAALAAIELKKASEKRKIALINLELAKARLALKTIKSPINGIVIDLYTMVGESVKDRAIMQLAQIDPLRVELIAPTEYFGIIKEGMEVEIRPERPSKKMLKATVTTVDKLIDPASGIFTVRMALPNSDDELVGGVNCMARFGFEAPLPLVSQGSY